MSGLQQAQLLYAAAVRSRVPPWAPFLQFPNVFGSPFLSSRHQLVNMATNNNGELPAAASNHSAHRSNPSDHASEDSNDDRGKFALSSFYAIFLSYSSLLLYLPSVNELGLVD